MNAGITIIVTKRKAEPGQQTAKKRRGNIFPRLFCLRKGTNIKIELITKL